MCLTDAWTGTWDKSVTKFMAFSLAYYDRVIALDSDITLLKPIDELFTLPETPIALPRAYWYKTKPWPLTSLLMVIKPNQKEFERFKNIIAYGGEDELVNAHKFDMELINDRFEDNALVLPHRPYALLSGEFRRDNHSAYLGDPMETWDAQRVYDEAKLVHFSDWPLPKPWIMWPLEGLAEMQPSCGGSHEGSCPERKIWKGLYEDFRARRKEVCRLLSVPAPDWEKIKASRPGTNVNITEGTGNAAPEVGSR
jgi:alpha-N-acetylglucosamine transferase